MSDSVRQQSAISAPRPILKLSTALGSSSEGVDTTASAAQARGIKQELLMQHMQSTDEYLQLRREFAQQRQQTSDQYLGLRKDVRQQSRQTNGQYLEIRKEIAQHRERYLEIKKEFEQQREQTEARFVKIQLELEQLREETDAKFSRFNALQKNCSARRLDSIIEPVPFYDGTRNRLVQPPKEFPHRVFIYWQLKNPKHLQRLVKLLTFYNTAGWERWGLDSAYDTISEDEEEAEPIILSHKSLDLAVHYAPRIAHEKLGRQIGLDYEYLSLHIPEDIESQRRRSEILSLTVAKRNVRSPA